MTGSAEVHTLAYAYAKLITPIRRTVQTLLRVDIRSWSGTSLIPVLGTLLRLPRRHGALVPCNSLGRISFPPCGRLSVSGREHMFLLLLVAFKRSAQASLPNSRIED
jgi:hypothetical protein